MRECNSSHEAMLGECIMRLTNKCIYDTRIKMCCKDSVMLIMKGIHDYSWTFLDYQLIVNYRIFPKSIDPTGNPNDVRNVRTVVERCLQQGLVPTPNYKGTCNMISIRWPQSIQKYGNGQQIIFLTNIIV